MRLTLRAKYAKIIKFDNVTFDFNFLGGNHNGHDITTGNSLLIIHDSRQFIFKNCDITSFGGTSPAVVYSKSNY